MTGHRSLRQSLCKVLDGVPLVELSERWSPRYRTRPGRSYGMALLASRLDEQTASLSPAFVLRRYDV